VKKPHRSIATAIALVLAALVAGCSINGDDENRTDTQSDFDLSATTHGPNGEPATPAADIEALTDEQAQEIAAMKPTLAILHGGSSTWFAAMEEGVKAEAARLGIEIVLTAQADFDPAKQASQVETAMARNPDIIVTLPVDPVSAAEAFKPAVDAGVKLLFVDNGIDGYEAGDQYVSIVTGDHFAMGRAAAELMADALGDQGKIGFIYHDADFYVTNNRDKYFKAVIEQEHPDIDIVDEAGFAEEGKTEEIASAMLTQHPDLDGIYVAWNAAATGVLAALRSAGNDHVKVVSHDLDATNDLEMATGGSLYGVAADRPFLEGEVMVRLAALSLLGESTPPFVIVDPVKETKDNIVEAWHDSLNQQPPPEILEHLE
jgi:ribose transport system substrate-binding protein